MRLLLLLFVVGAVTALDTRIILKQTYKHHSSDGRYSIELPSRASIVESIRWCSNAFIPLLGRSLPAIRRSKQVDCKQVPLMNVPLRFPSKSVEVDIHKSMVVVDPHCVARGEWNKLQSNLIIRSGGAFGQYEQIIRFAGDEAFVPDVSSVALATDAAEAVVALDPSTVYYVTLAGGVMIMLVTIMLVVFRRNTARIRQWIESNRSYSPESIYDFEVIQPAAASLSQQDILMRLGRGANTAYSANLK